MKREIHLRDVSVDDLKPVNVAQLLLPHFVGLSGAPLVGRRRNPTPMDHSTRIFPTRVNTASCVEHEDLFQLSEVIGRSNVVEEQALTL